MGWTSPGLSKWQKCCWVAQSSPIVAPSNGTWRRSSTSSIPVWNPSKLYHKRVYERTFLKTALWSLCLWLRIIPKSETNLGCLNVDIAVAHFFHEKCTEISLRYVTTSCVHFTTTDRPTDLSTPIRRQTEREREGGRELRKPAEDLARARSFFRSRSLAAHALF